MYQQHTEQITSDNTTEIGVLFLPVEVKLSLSWQPRQEDAREMGVKLHNLTL